MKMFDRRFKFRDLLVAPNSRKFLSNEIDNEWARQLARRGEIIIERIENLVDGGNFPSRARFQPFTHINGRRV